MSRLTDSIQFESEGENFCWQLGAGDSKAGDLGVGDSGVGDLKAGDLGVGDSLVGDSGVGDSKLGDSEGAPRIIEVVFIPQYSGVVTSV